MSITTKDIEALFTTFEVGTLLNAVKFTSPFTNGNDFDAVVDAVEEAVTDSPKSIVARQTGQTFRNFSPGESYCVFVVSDDEARVELDIARWKRFFTTFVIQKLNELEGLTR